MLCESGCLLHCRMSCNMCSTEFVTAASRCKIPARKLAFGMHWEKHFQMCQQGIYNVQVGYDMLWCFYKRILGHKIHKHRDTMQITSSDSLAWWSDISSVTSWNLCWKTPFWKHGGYWYTHIFNVFHTSIRLIFDILLPHIAASTWHCAKDPHNLTSVHPGEELKIQRPEIGEGLMASVLPIWKRINPTLRRNAWVKVDRTTTKR